MLYLYSLPIVVGLLVGWSRGGRPSRLSELRVQHLWLVWMAVVVQATQRYAPAIRRLLEDDLGVPMLVLVFGCIAVWLLVNLPAQTRGVRMAIVVVLAGGAINGVAILANGRMPFSVPAAQYAGVPNDKVVATDLPKHEPASTGTSLAWLGDVIPVRPIHKVVSVGDIVILAGIALLVAAGTMTPWSRAGPGHHPAPASRRPAAPTGSSAVP
jgi:Family of unknown function (DUF5317)